MEEVQQVIQALRVDEQLQRIFKQLGLDPLILANEIENAAPTSELLVDADSDRSSGHF